MKTNNKLMAKITTLLLSLFYSNFTFAQIDTVEVIVRGDFPSKKHQFMLQYEGETLGSFGYKEGLLFVKIPIDASVQKPYTSINLKVVQARGKFFKSRRLLFLYYPEFKYIHVYFINTDEFGDYFSVFYLPSKESLFAF